MNRDDADREYERESIERERGYDREMDRVSHTDEAWADLVDRCARGEREAKLELAVLLLDEVRETLDQSGGACETCGMKHYKNWPERQAAVELRAVADKIDRIRRNGIKSGLGKGA